MIMNSLLEVKGLKKYFPREGTILRRQKGVVRAVDGVDLQLYPGETLGLVGESGSGKTTLGRLIVRLEKPTEGEILFLGRDLTRLKGVDLLEFRRQIQIIFQDPYSSLNPRMSAAAIISEPLKIHYKEKLSNRQVSERIGSMMNMVGLDPSIHMLRYPHEFSGGQRQRIGIARALIMNPKIIIADEPVSSLDVSVRAQILYLMKKLQGELNLTYLFITHDLGVVRQMSDRVAVMYLGKIVEIGPTERICTEPAHPYTMALLSSVPEINPNKRRKRIILRGEVPTPLSPPAGCVFHSRCPFCEERCAYSPPANKKLQADHFVLCHRPIA